MRRFYQLYRFVQTVSGHFPVEIIQTPSDRNVLSIKGKTKKALKNKQNVENIGKTISFQLSWSHYCELIKMDNNLERSFYQQQSINENWSVRELQRQKDTSLFERIALCKDHKGVMTIAQKGQVPESEIDIVRDPYILGFLNIPEKQRYTVNT